jgi:alpha-galactosidase
LEYVSADQSQAVLFVYQLTNAVPVNVKLRGLNAGRTYLVRELNLAPSEKSRIEADGNKFDGATLMAAGLLPACRNEFESAVIKLSAVK